MLDEFAAAGSGTAGKTLGVFPEPVTAAGPAREVVNGGVGSAPQAVAVHKVDRISADANLMRFRAGIVRHLYVKKQADILRKPVGAKPEPRSMSTLTVHHDGAVGR